MLLKAHLRVLAVVGGVLSLLAFAPAVEKKGSPKMEHNAFLRKPVFSAKGLTDQVVKDQVVLRRYEKHFMMGKGGLVKYMKDLKLKPLPETRRYLVYNVDGNLTIRKRMLTMRRGTMVFVDQTGKPILKRSCGNPMITYLPPRGETTNAYTPIKDIDTEPELIEEPNDGTLIQPNDPITAGVEPVIDPVNPEVVQPPINLTPTPATTPVLPAIGSGVPLWPLFVIPLIPILVNRPSQDPIENFAPVPEPTGIAALTIAGLGLAARRRRKK
ncbi:PEP-CTERM sorting domain-containing protein [bacterium]|nr:MAG: PEP-CTERM sorting domain-containing protein [bacterium]